MMRFPSLKTRMLSASRVVFTATAALIVFTAGVAFLGSGQAFASSQDGDNKPFSLRLRSTKDAGGFTTLHVSIIDNATHDVLATPSVKLDSTRPASTRTTVDDYVVDTDVRPAADGRTSLTVTISKNGQEIQKSSMFALPSADNPARVYTGQKISLDLRDADIRDVLGTFGKITGLQMQIDADVQGKVTVHWHDVPWDEAFDQLVNENGLTWAVKDNTAHISRK